MSRQSEMQVLLYLGAFCAGGSLILMVLCTGWFLLHLISPCGI